MSVQSNKDLLSCQLFCYAILILCRVKAMATEKNFNKNLKKPGLENLDNFIELYFVAENFSSLPRPPEVTGEAECS